jgi:hypothetical protein
MGGIRPTGGGSGPLSQTGKDAIDCVVLATPNIAALNLAYARSWRLIRWSALHRTGTERPRAASVGSREVSREPSYVDHRTRAIRMYARFCLAYYGTTAGVKAKDKARALARKGDSEGCRVWNEVADEIEKAQDRRRRPTFRPS